MTKYFGVSQAGERFKAQINRKGKVFYLGTYDDIQTAARIADASGLISAAWTNIPPRLNFSDSTPTVPEAWNEHQKSMMAFLRENFREDEKASVRQQAVAMHTPEIMFEHFLYAERKLDDVVESIRRVLADGKQVLRDAAIKASEDDKIKAWQRDRITELEQQLLGRKHVEEIKAQNGGVLMRPVAPVVLPPDNYSDLIPVEVPGVVIRPLEAPVGTTVEQPPSEVTHV